MKHNCWSKNMMYSPLFCLGWKRWDYWDYKEDCTYHFEAHAVENLMEIGEDV